MSGPTRRKRSTAYGPGMPAEGDISRFHVDAPVGRHVAKVIGYVVLQIPVWWRRGGFHTEPFRDTAPKWHVLRARFHSGAPEDWNVIWVAQCGYEYANNELISWFRNFRKTTPKKAERCLKCEEALAEIQRELALKKADRA